MAEVNEMQTTPMHRRNFIIADQNIQRIAKATRILKYEHGLKKWRTTFLSMRIKSFDQLEKWKILIFHRTPNATTHSAQQLPDGKIRIEISLQDDLIKECPGDIGPLLPSPSRHRRSDIEIILTRNPTQQNEISRQQDHVDRGITAI
ncbi:hypothetical protein XaFJ1_GM000753 [Xanthomonas albilineans]|nr:hypothetical protein XalbCFBP2523_11805 [Xanthomonas albilineans]QHQ27505.1 hypothetical protein XaFJ1_GM000753 [Xanthomonas albilineans]